MVDIRCTTPEGEAMDATVLYAMKQRLRGERDRLWEEAVGADSDLQALGETARASWRRSPNRIGWHG